MSFTQHSKFKVDEKFGKELTILFFFWPLLSFIIAMRNFGNKNARKIVIAFFSFFGFTMNFARESMDGFFHAQKFAEATRLSNDAFSKLIVNFILRQGNSQELDIYTTVVNFVMSRFTDSFHYVFLLHAFVFSYFSVKTFGIIYDEFEGKISKNAMVFFVLIFFLLPVNIVHGIRFPIGSWMFIYGAYQLIRTGSKKHLLFCLLACFVHFSFILPLILTIAYSFLGNKNYIYISLLLASILFPSLFYSYLGSLDKADVGEGVEDKISGYSREDYIKMRNTNLENRNWYAKFRIPILQYAFYSVLLLITVVKKNYYKQDQVQQNLFSFLILFLAFVNFGFAFDSLGRRFLLVWFVFAAIFIFRFFQLNDFKYYSFYTKIFIFPILLWIFVQLRVALDVMTYMFLIGNPVTAAFIEMDAILK
jgi:hypothetical protein